MRWTLHYQTHTAPSTLIGGDTPPHRMTGAQVPLTNPFVIVSHDLVRFIPDAECCCGDAWYA